jgi:major membrane immunogen (membrane-anchored lipoprotein)
VLKFRLIVTIVFVSLLLGCGPSKLEQTVAEGNRKLEERRERDRIKAEIESAAAEKRWQQTLVEMNRKREAEAELSRL